MTAINEQMPQNGAAQRTVLVVEDDPDLSMLTTIILEEMGFHVLAAPNGDQALYLLTGPAVIDLMVTDVVMPGTLDGVALADRALRLRPDLRVLLVSGYPGHALERRAAGVRKNLPLLKKPFRASQLEAAIRDLLGDCRPNRM